jgi:hypothetical protein
VFFITLEVSPKPIHPRYGEVDGAYAACWVDEPTAALAESAARESIDGAQWDVVERDELREIAREELLDHPEGLELYDQATLDGLVITFHTWPAGGDDEE